MERKKVGGNLGGNVPKCSQGRLILRARIPIRHAQGTAERKAKGANEIPKGNVPAQQARGGPPPCVLRLEHVQRAADDEAAAADDLGDPVGGIEAPLRVEVVEDARERGKAGDAKDGGAKELGGAGEEAQLVDVVRAQVVPGRVPLPMALLLSRLRAAAAAAGGRQVEEMTLGLSDEIGPVLLVVTACVPFGDKL